MSDNTNILSMVELKEQNLEVLDSMTIGGFYRKLGFEFTGEYDEGEAVMRLKL